MVSDRHGVRSYIRPTKAEARPWIEQGLADPKPEMLKAKTIEPADIYLGFPKTKVGTVGCKQPILPKTKPRALTLEEWEKVQKKSAERSAEFIDQAPKLRVLVKEGKITWNEKTGEIFNAKTDKPYAGDNDAFVSVDAKTGDPVSPAVNRQINREFKSLGATTHDEHLGWDYTGQDHELPKGASPGSKSPYDTDAGIDQKILHKHSKVGGEPLNTYDPLVGGDEGWTTSWWEGGQRKFGSTATES